MAGALERVDRGEAAEVSESHRSVLSTSEGSACNVRQGLRDGGLVGESIASLAEGIYDGGASHAPPCGGGPMALNDAL